MPLQQDLERFLKTIWNACSCYPKKLVLSNCLFNFEEAFIST